MSEGTIAAACALRLVTAAAAEGIDPATLPTPHLGDASEGLETRIPYADMMALWEATMRSVKDPGFPVRCGGRANPDEFDAVGFACMTRETLREAIRQMLRFSKIWCDATEWTFQEHERESRLAVRLAGEPLRLGNRAGAESVMAEMIQAARILTARDVEPLAVRFRHARPAKTDAHEAFFRAPIAWGADATEIVMPVDLLDIPLVKADSAMAAFFERHVTQMLGKFAEPESLARRIRAVLSEDLRSGLPSLESTAQRLAMSSRTLRRRLQDEGTTFQDVLDEVRADLAKRYLGDADLPVGSVAFLLGFSEPSAFHRAFKRWTGTTPLAFRRTSSSRSAA